MNIKKVLLLVKSLRELLTITVFLSHSTKSSHRCPSKRYQNDKKNYKVYSELTKYDPLSALKILCINHFVDLKIYCLQKTKATSFMSCSSWEVIHFSTLVTSFDWCQCYPFLAFSGLTCHLKDTGVGILWLHCAAWQ